MKLSIGIAATAGYTVAMKAQARSIVRQLDIPDKVTIIIAGDNSAEVKAVVAYYKELAPTWDVIHLVKAGGDGGANYEKSAQLLIASLREAIMLKVVALGSDYLWMLDSDVLPKANAFRCMLDMLKFDGGYYGVSFCPYPSNGGGGSYLSGRGTPQNPITPNHLEDELQLTDEIKKEQETLDKELKDLETKYKEIKLTDTALIEEAKAARDDWQKRAQDLKKKMEQCPPKGNVFALNAVKWRARGWFDFAYPGIGKGAIVPVDWIGFGCTLMGREAIKTSSFDGYEGGGTEDLYINFRRWHQHGIRICSIPHCPADHVVRKDGRDKNSGYLHCRVYHETEGEMVGHLRTHISPWVDIEQPFDLKSNK